MESVYTLKYYISDILNLSSTKIEKNLKIKEIERRKLSIESYFNDIKSSFIEYRHLIITKLDTLGIDPVKLFYLIRSSGNFGIVIERFLLPHLKEGKSKNKFLEFRDLAYIINKSLLGLYYSYLAKETSQFKRSFKFYQNAEKNYQNIVDYCNINNILSTNSLLYHTGKFYSILVRFTIIIRNILDKNPRYFSERLEELLQELGKFEIKNIHFDNLYKQIENIIQLERDTVVLLKNIRIDNPFLLTESFNEDKLLTEEENLDKLNRVRNWISSVSEKYQNYQNHLLKLHSGRIVKYLNTYRTEIFNYRNKNAEKFDDLLGVMINKALETYNSETVEALDILSDLMHKNIYSGNLLERFKIGYNDIIRMDDLVNKFVKNLFKKPLLRNLESEYYKKIISVIADKHSEFDKHILRYIIRLLNDFEEIRNRKILSLEEQRNKFISEIKPNLQKLIDLSFTLNEEILPYPLFIDIKTQNQKLKVNNPETITLIIENPNLTDIRNIVIHFLTESLENKLKITTIKKLKANERKKIKIRVNPRFSGSFLSMVMIEYQHSNKTFWMPSMKFKLEVAAAKEYVYYPVLNKEHYQNELQATRILKLNSMY